VFWCRQSIALVVGLGAGILGFTGAYVIIAFFIALFLLSYIYYSKVLDINEEDFG
jgi:EMC6